MALSARPGITCDTPDPHPPPRDIPQRGRKNAGKLQIAPKGHFLVGVMVKKSWYWRCAWTFTDLNKACPDKTLSTTEIDWKWISLLRYYPSRASWTHKGVIHPNPNGQYTRKKDSLSHNQGVLLLYKDAI
ncbi:hypothetical protein Tco_1459043 [Tanacetum coccineum]